MSRYSRTFLALAALAAAAFAVGSDAGCARAVDPVPTKAVGLWYVYSDDGAEQNHFIPNYMPGEAAKDIHLDPACTVNPKSGKTCIKVTFDFKNSPWAGVSCASGDQVWGDKECPSYNLAKAKKLVFYARGETGKERIQAKVGICGDKPHGDSLPTPIESEWLPLKKEFTRYEVPMRGDTSRIITPFVIVVNSDMNGGADSMTVYLDDLHFELE
jgi:hypothetical protein